MLNKRIFLSNTTLLVFLLSLCAVSFAASGNKDLGAELRETEPSETEPKDGEPARVETETWVAVDLPFTSNKSYGEGEQVYARFDVAFTNQ
ncbi:MAG: hypothetical protein IKX88_17340, partial [Thermoguttaceae bacterium]|nr:hypothetical protein [Thermoguttaceae bacterium]